MLLPRELDLVAAGKSMPLPRPKPALSYELVAKKGEAKNAEGKKPETRRAEAGKVEVKNQGNRAHGHRNDAAEPQPEKARVAKAPIGDAKDRKKSLVKLSQQAHPANNGTPKPGRREADANKGDGDQAHGQKDRAKPQAEKTQAEKVPISKSKKAKEFGKTSHTG